MRKESVQDSLSRAHNGKSTTTEVDSQFTIQIKYTMIVVNTKLCVGGFSAVILPMANKEYAEKVFMQFANIIVIRSNFCLGEHVSELLVFKTELVAGEYRIIHNLQ